MVIEGFYSPAPHPKDHNRELDPKFEEDPDICVVLAEGVFYETSYDGTEVAIIADYPGLLPASHISDPNTPYSKEISPSFLPTALSCAQKGKGSARRTTPRVPSKRASPTPGEPSKRKANEDTAVPSSKRYESANLHLSSHAQP